MTAAPYREIQQSKEEEEKRRKGSPPGSTAAPSIKRRKRDKRRALERKRYISKHYFKVWLCSLVAGPALDLHSS